MTREEAIKALNTFIRIPEIHWCREHSMLCTNAGIWNECRLTACNKKWLKEIKREENNMTNRERLESLSDEALAKIIGLDSPCGICNAENGNCYMSCADGVEAWLKAEWNYPDKPKEFTQDQLKKVFRDKFMERRAIGILEIENVIRELYE